MTGKPFQKSFQSSLLDPLSMKRTTLETPKDKGNAIIPDNDLLSWWNITTGDSSPYGGMFSTAADLTRLGQSIFKSSILDPPTTGSWLKPITHTADLRMSVGMPWEIHRAHLPLGNGTRVVDLYTKNGALGLYTAIIVLSPEHELGYVALMAGAGRNRLLSYLPDLVTQKLLPAAEDAAREVATKQFSGIFKSRESQMTIVMDDTLVIKKWTRGDMDVLAIYAALQWPGLQLTPVLRLYPMGLEEYGRMSFRGILEVKVDKSDAEVAEVSAGSFSSGCLSWGVVGALTYGNVGFDDFEFEINQDGKATGLRPRVMRETLKRVN
ncbi:hypothetical protein NW762_011546 [Fusarium torreyae]|uniref:Beta-lactamase-related domain-containing protein n=1 Tax=Fusarium torreyae TaxID=1237075 RepID=A0A9W8RNY9_9HYPO|nr:hypothetical protein NW762_011546 [Fusarium torreyae]